VQRLDLPQVYAAVLSSLRIESSAAGCGENTSVDPPKCRYAALAVANLGESHL